MWPVSTTSRPAETAVPGLFPTDPSAASPVVEHICDDADNYLVEARLNAGARAVSGCLRCGYPRWRFARLGATESVVRIGRIPATYAAR